MHNGGVDFDVGKDDIYDDADNDKDNVVDEQSAVQPEQLPGGVQGQQGRVQHNVLNREIKMFNPNLYKVIVNELYT